MFGLRERGKVFRDHDVRLDFVNCSKCSVKYTHLRKVTFSPFVKLREL